MAKIKYYNIVLIIICLLMLSSCSNVSLLRKKGLEELKSNWRFYHPRENHKYMLRLPEDVYQFDMKFYESEYNCDTYRYATFIGHILNKSTEFRSKYFFYEQTVVKYMSDVKSTYIERVYWIDKTIMYEYISEDYSERIKINIDDLLLTNPDLEFLVYTYEELSQPPNAVGVASVSDLIADENERLKYIIYDNDKYSLSFGYNFIDKYYYYKDNLNNNSNFKYNFDKKYDVIEVYADKTRSDNNGKVYAYSEYHITKYNKEFDYELPSTYDEERTRFKHELFVLPYILKIDELF